MKKTKEQTGTSKLKIIMSRHGEGLHNVAGRKISQIWKDEVNKIREQITSEFGDTPEINEIYSSHIKTRKIRLNYIELIS